MKLNYTKHLEISHQLPCIEVHAGQAAIVGLCYVNIQGLRLINESPTSSSHVQNDFLLDFPHSLVQVLHIIRDAINVLQQR